MPLRRKRATGKKPQPATAVDANLMSQYARAFLEASASLGQSQQTIAMRARALKRFAHWCAERGIDEPREVTLAVLERYQRTLFHHRKPDGTALAFSSQQTYLIPLKSFFRWLTRQRYLLTNPASELTLPKLPKSLPRHVLTIQEVESILNRTDVATPAGIRDRAMLETFYSTGVRRTELAQLRLYDLNLDRGTLMVRGGKGGKDRLVPVGERACAWLTKYLDEVRPQLVLEPDSGILFLTDFGEAFEKGRLGALVKGYIRKAGLTVAGCCHLFRHACATHMLEAGADIRYIQVLLGHEDLTSTQIYTQVSILKLKEIHAATHPARLEHADEARRNADTAIPVDPRQALQDALEAESGDDDE